MHGDWTEWTRTELRPEEREALRGALTAEQEEKLARDDYVWAQGIGVLWKPADGLLRRARFTHGTYFETGRGAFYMDSEGVTRELGAAPPLREARPAIH